MIPRSHSTASRRRTQPQRRSTARPAPTTRRRASCGLSLVPGWFPSLVWGLQVFWVLNLLFCEWLIFPLVIHTCRFPTIPGSGGTAHHALIMSDPQLTDAYSYDQSGAALALTQFYSDVYMWKAFTTVMRSVPPIDTVLMLGDAFDGGRVADSSSWEHHVRRYHQVFPTPSDVAVHTAAGNHDIGMGTWCNDAHVKRFQRTFGPVNQVATVGNFSVVIVNAPALFPGTDLQCPVAYDEAWGFVKAVATQRGLDARTLLQRGYEAPLGRSPMDGLPANAHLHTVDGSPYVGVDSLAAGLPRVLITHVPLFKPNNAQCGPRRGPRPFRRGCGRSYCNTLSGQDSQALALVVEPMLVLSGDDHDICEFLHGDGDAAMPEVTAGTISWLQGEWSPSVILMSMWNGGGGSEPEIQMEVCRLPGQLPVFLWYGFSAAASVVAVMVGAIIDLQRGGHIDSGGWHQAGRRKKGDSMRRRRSGTDGTSSALDSDAGASAPPLRLPPTPSDVDPTATWLARLAVCTVQGREYRCTASVRSGAVRGVVRVVVVGVATYLVIKGVEALRLYGV